MSRNDTFLEDLVAAMPMLRRFAIALCKDASRADDLVQETMLRALGNRASFEIGSNMGAWLTTILKNLFLSGKRRNREIEDPDNAIAASVVVEDSPLRKMEVCELLALVDKLPEPFRVPLRLIADGATYEEAAAEIHEHVGTIKSRVNRAREMLKAAS